jgi:acetyl esterase/lipase
MDARTELDPEADAAFAGLPMAAVDFGTYTFADLPGVRDMMDNAPRPPLPPTTTVSEERNADGVPVRVYTPAGAASPAPAVLWVHGGACFGTGLGKGGLATSQVRGAIEAGFIF